MNAIRTKLVLLSFLILSCFLVQAGGKGNPRLDSIRLTGVIFNNEKPVKNLVIRVFERNKMIKEVVVKRLNRFTTNIPLNSMLTIEINAEDYHTKRFIFDTHVPERPKVQMKYHFDIDIFKESEIANVNMSMLDFPVGLVSYNEKKKAFIRDKKYTKRMKKTYLGLWNEAQSVARQGEGLE